MTMDPGLWEDHARRDLVNPQLIGLDGEVHTYQNLVDNVGNHVAPVLNIATYQEKHDRAQRGLDTLASLLSESRPDVVVIIGDDQNELFGTSGIPAVGIFTGESVYDVPRSPESLARLSEGMRQSAWTSHSDVLYEHAVHSALARYLVNELTLNDFDLTQVTQQSEGTSIGHAFNFIRYRLHLDAATPIVPILLNTYYPPNVPSPERCYRLGQIVGRAIDSFEEDLRVAVIGSGGLSHFVVLEDFDASVLKALQNRDVEAISGLARRFFRSGTSESLNWIAAAGALEHLSMEIIDYVPGYRSPAGTGTGMAFASWR
jgi:hypothetical protein